ncbi:hypothetical protein BDF21DRAFT_394188 [Thamnidium elegans]|nr:hypothetical protein BDF21DRAFT_394188 [Thamnidium elegans]
MSCVFEPLNHLLKKIFQSGSAFFKWLLLLAPRKISSHSSLSASMCTGSTAYFTRCLYNKYERFGRQHKLNTRVLDSIVEEQQSPVASKDYNGYDYLSKTSIFLFFNKGGSKNSFIEDNLLIIIFFAINFVLVKSSRKHLFFYARRTWLISKIYTMVVALDKRVFKITAIRSTLRKK